VFNNVENLKILQHFNFCLILNTHISKLIHKGVDMFSMKNNTNFNRNDSKSYTQKSERGTKKDSERGYKKDSGRSYKNESEKGYKHYGEKKSHKRSDEKENYGKNDDRNSNNRQRSEDKVYLDNENNPLQLEGRHAVLEAIENDRVIDKILLKQGEIVGTLKVILAKAKEKGIVIQEVSRIKLDEISESGNHQGVIGMCPAYPYYEISDMLQKAKQKKEHPFIIILDEITDPHNLGAIIRTAEACGAHGIVIPKRRAVGLTGVVSKISSGAIEHVMVARVNSIVNVIDMLKKQNIWVACADTSGQNLYSAPLEGAIAVVIGNEGAGVGKLIHSKCDFSVKIPMMGKIQSLNASVAAGILLYEVVRKRHHIK
jgi:23S rRNA (guanosine2251-2'-O)-methyltransferase